MSKVITFRITDEGLAILDGKATAAGVSRTDYILGAILGTADDSEYVKGLEGNLQAVTASRDALARKVTELENEQLKASRFALPQVTVARTETQDLARFSGSLPKPGKR